MARLLAGGGESGERAPDGQSRDAGLGALICAHEPEIQALFLSKSSKAWVATVGSRPRSPDFWGLRLGEPPLKEVMMGAFRRGGWAGSGRHHRNSRNRANLECSWARLAVTTLRTSPSTFSSPGPEGLEEPEERNGSYPHSDFCCYQPHTGTAQMCNNGRRNWNTL